MLADHQNINIEGLEVPDALSKDNYGFWNNKIPVSIINIIGTGLVDPEVDSREIAVAGRVYAEMYRFGEIGLMMQWEHEQVKEVFGEEEGAHHLETGYGYLLDKRNKNWVNRLLPILKKQSNLIVVGASPLPGDAGLVELLRREGMTVNRVVLPEEASPR